ncbi:hypothetical protein SUGI_0899600 [Cryptomeria japonica]|nr:hypothetical protein SUGI_0899600 [Cryptomeria japonica]
MDYILGEISQKMSYVVGNGNYYPKHVHHRATSIPKNNVNYSYTEGYKWRDNSKPNSHVITTTTRMNPQLQAMLAWLQPWLLYQVVMTSKLIRIPSFLQFDPCFLYLPHPLYYGIAKHCKMYV